MKLSECLNTADIATLRAIAERYALPCSRHSKLALLQEIMYTFKSDYFLREQLDTWLNGREYAMLRLSLEQRRVFSQEELDGVLQTGTDAHAVDVAVHEGWLFPTTRYGGRLMYCIPEELHAKIRQAMVQRFTSQLETTDDGPLLFEESGHAMARDIDVFLEYVRNHEVRLTTEGSMYKRNLLQVLELLEVPEEPLQSGWRFGYGRRFHDYPDRFALLYDYMYQANLVSEDNDGFLRLSDGLSNWAQMDMLERQRALVRFYMTTYRRPIKRLPQVAQLIAHAALKWTHSEAMLRALSDLVQPYYYDDQAQVWKTRILKMLMHLGLIRTGTDENQCDWFQITELGQQLLTPDALPVSPDQTKEKQRILIVQPNFEIVVTTEQPMITAQLSLFAELRQAGVIRVYRMTEESIRKGVTAGKSLRAWLDFLHAYSQTDVPGNVERTIEEWDRMLAAERAAEDDTLSS